MSEIQTIKESSKKLYQSNLKRLNDNQEPEDYQFLKNTTKILDKIKHLKDNTKRTYLISIVSVLKDQPKFKKPFDIYYNLMMEFNKNLKTNTTKSETQNANWMEQEEIKKLWETSKTDVIAMTKGKRKLTEAEFEQLTHYLVLSLYVLIPPRRNDYLKMLVLLEPSELKPDYNYLDVKNKQFIFQCFKTDKTYKTQTIDIPKELMDVITLYLKFRKEKTNQMPFLIKPDGTPFESINAVTRILNKIFKKKISVSLLRNIYLTDKYSKENKEKALDATAMATSVNMIDNNYTKQD
jgi:hypothetical protein